MIHIEPNESMAPAIPPVQVVAVAVARVAVATPAVVHRGQHARTLSHVEREREGIEVEEAIVVVVYVRAERAERYEGGHREEGDFYSQAASDHCSLKRARFHF